MDDSAATVSRTAQLLQRARQGDQAALGVLLDQHRPYLKLISERYLFGGLKARIDSSDIVQQTCLSAHKRIADFGGDDPAGFLAWLREVHLQNVKNVLRDHLHTAKRSLTREEASAASLILEDHRPLETPSQRMMHSEMAVTLAAALEQLTEPQREAIRCRFLEGLPLKAVAARMERSEPTVVGLIHRGLAKLKDILPMDLADVLP